MEVTTARGTFWVQDLRKEDDKRPPLLLVHGAGGMHLDWHSDLRRKMPMSAIAVDLNGHGKSGGGGHQDVGEYALDMVALLDKMGIAQVVVVGHSMGGAIAQVMALQHKDRVAGLVLVGTGARLIVNEAILEGIIAETQQTIDLIMKWAWGQDTPDDWRVMGAKRLSETPPLVTYHDYVACNNFDVRDSVHTLTVPTLIVSGEQDKMVKPSLGAYLHEQIEGSEFITLPCGHMIPVEAYAGLGEAIEAWYQKHYGTNRQGS